VIERREATRQHVRVFVRNRAGNAAKGIGLPRQPEHDTRYDIAEEYMQIVYKLWEGSWEDGAVASASREPGAIAGISAADRSPAPAPPARLPRRQVSDFRSEQRPASTRNE
jgi:alkanesulfonate monooxygenase SsuD/methylene tetrahydromethanopterin reductase-like flavin-dependent oxidoreductase (luciferase family)